MQSLMHPALAAERGFELLQAAAGARAARDAVATRLQAPRAPHIAEAPADVPIAIRLAGPADAPALARLAELDDRSDHAPRLARLATRPWAGTVLVAETDDGLAAALIVDDGLVVADPFERTDGLVALLRLRAAQLAGGSARRWLPRAGAVLRPRLHRAGAGRHV